MNTNHHRAALAAKTVALRASVAAAAASLEVDESAGTIRNAAIMTVGDAAGHGFSLDAESLRQLAALINASDGGVKVRFRHPESRGDGTTAESLGTQVAHIPPSVRVEGDSLRGDIVFGGYAESVPGLGNVKQYLLKLAAERPRDFGLSAVIGYDAEPVLDATGNPTSIVARINEVQSVDLVEVPAANPNGLLASIDVQKGVTYEYTIGNRSVVWTAPTVREVIELRNATTNQPNAGGIVPARPTTTTKQLSNGDSLMEFNDNMKPHLSKLGMKDDEDAKAFFGALTDEQKGELAKLMEEEKPVDDKLAAATPAQMAARRQVVTDNGDAELAREGKRVTQVNQLAAILKVPAEVTSLAVAHGDDVIQAKARFLKHLSETARPIHAVKVGEDKNRASLRASLSDAILIRAGQKVEKPHERATQLSGLTLIDMGRQYLAANGVSEAMQVSRSRVWEMLARPQQYGGQYAMLAQSTDSFANITLDAVNKSLRTEYGLAPSTWNIWARRATAPDFKNINRIALSDVPGLVARSEGGEIKYNVLSDSKETYTLAEYTNGIRLTRQAIINDDLDAFSRIPRAQATTAKQLEDDVCYAILTANAALADTVALFHASHSNLGTAGAISVTTLGEARKLMRVQEGPKGNKLNLSPKFLLVPAALETLADQFTSANYVAAVQTTINPFANNGRTPLVPVVEARLDDSSATAWYVAADNSRIDTVEVCFLMDEPEPVLKQETDFDTDDIKFAVRHTTAAKAIDYRGLVKNAGA